MAEQIERQKAIKDLQDSANKAAALEQAGEYAEAETLQRAEDRRTLLATRALAQTLWYQGRYHEAEEKLEYLANCFERDYGWSDVDTLEVAGNLVATYLEQGKYDKAKVLARKLLHHRNQVFGKDSPEALATEEYLASIYLTEGDLNKAAEIRERILSFAIQRQEDPLIRAAAFAAYGNILRVQGKLGDSKRNLLRAVELSKIAIGSAHPRTIDYQSLLAALYFDQRDYKSACDVGGEVLKAREKSLGDTHDRTITSMSDQAAYLFVAGAREESQAQIERAVQLARQYLEGRNPTRSSVLSNASAMYRLLGCDHLAKELSFESFDSSRREMGDNSPETLSAMMEYSRCLLRDGELVVGREIMKLCVQRTERTYGSDHELTKKRRLELEMS